MIVPRLILDEGTGNTTLVIGSSKSGKSTLLMAIYDCYYKKGKYITTLFAANTQINLYKNRAKLIHCNGFDKDAQKYVRQQAFINNKCDNKYNFVNIYDDIIDVRHKKILNESILTLRNSNLSSIIALQYSHLFSKQARSNVNNVIMFAFNTDEAIEGTIKVFCGSIFRKLGVEPRDYTQYYKDMTVNHNFLYLHTASGYLFSSLKGDLLPGA